MAIVALAPLALFQPALAQTFDTTTFEFQPPTTGENILREAPDLLQQGVWRHETKLSLPPTPFAARPDISIVGGHRSGGLAGKHWTLKGFAAIERRGPNGGAPTRTAADTFQYQGIRLIETGNPTDRPRRFRLEKDDNHVFSYYPRRDSWSMSKDGWTHRFGDLSNRDGANASERFHFAIGRNEICRSGQLVDTVLDVGVPQPNVPGQGKVLKWHLRRVSDPAGNAVQFRYTGPCDCDPLGKLALACPHLPKQVDYNTAQISFDFEDQPDTRIMARDGVPRYFNKRLSRITSTVKGTQGAQVFSDYKITYQPGAPRSLLQRIERLGTDNTSRVLAEAEYDMSPTGFQPGAAIPAIQDIMAEYPSQHVVPHVVNFDGDGFPDLVLIDERIDGYPNTLGLARGYRNNGQDDFSFIFDPDMTDMLTAALGQTAENGFEDPRREPGLFKFADIDGDGRTELHATGGGIWEYEPGLGYRETGWAESNVGDSQYLLVDIDGDGLDDKVEPGNTPKWTRNQGQAPFFPNGTQQDITLPVDYADEFGLDIRRLMDLCGTGAYTGWISEDYHAYYGTLSTLGTAAYAYPDEYWQGQINYSDVTGDGIADMIYAINNCPDLDDADQDTFAWSKVFIGRGDGSFVYTDMDAGPPFLQANSPVDVGNPDTDVDLLYYGDRHEYFLDWKNWSPVDFDGDGVVEIMHRPDGETRLYSAHFKNAQESWGRGPDDPAALALPPRIKALSTYSRMGYKPYNCGCFFHQVTLPADWDGDGFTDLFVLERDAVSDGAPLSDRSARFYETYLFRNTRQAPHYALTSVRVPDGGKIGLTYAGSARNGMNKDLPMSLSVVDTVTDDRGTSRFFYSGGRIEQGEFLGFAEVEGVHENGLSFEAEYSLSPAFRGDLVARTERRRDGTIERFTHYERMRLATSIFSFDAAAPFFNPVRRVCQFEVSHYQGAGPGLPPDPTEDALFKAQLGHACTTHSRPGLDWITEPRLSDFLGLLNGWDPREMVGHRREGLSNVAQLRELLSTLPNRPLNRPLRPMGDKVLARADAAALPWKRLRTNGLPPTRGRSLAIHRLHAPIVTDLPALSGLIGPLALPGTSAGGPGLIQTSTPSYRMFVKDFSYNSDQRLSRVDDLNLSTEPDDTVTTTFGYGPYQDHTVQGAELVSWARSYANTSYSMAFRNHFAFGMPGEIEETGTDGATRSRSFDYDKSGRMIEARQQLDHSGRMSTERFTYDDRCGLRDSVTDAAGRVLTYGRDAHCRLAESQFRGGRKTFERDGLGRIVETLITPDTGAPKRTYAYYNDAFNTPLTQVDHVELTENLAVATFRDSWGRAVLTLRCTLSDDQVEKPPTKIDEIACAKDSEHYTLRAWASDGTQRLTTGEFRRAERPYMAFTYFDERGRLSRRTEQDHSYQAKPSDLLAGFDVTSPLAWVDTEYKYGLGFTRTDNPGGHSCIERYSTLSREVECAGRIMASYKLDPEGRITAETDEMGVGTSFIYDGFFNLASETTNTRLETCGAPHANPSVSYGYDLRGRLLSKTLANGAILEWRYDDIGRLLSAEFRDGASGTVLEAGSWTYLDNPATGLARIETDGNGNQTTRYHDAFGRPTRTVLPDGSYTETQRDAFGRPTLIRDIDGITQHFTYDALGRLTEDYILIPRTETQSCTRHEAGNMCRVGTLYEYDGSGRIIADTDADGVRQRHGYNAHGQLTFSARGPWVMQAASYNEDGTPDWIWTDGAHTRFTYDAWMRPSEICEGADLAAGTCTRHSKLGRDAAGRITSRSLDGAAPATLVYDDVGRLSKETTPLGGTRNYRYGVATPVCAMEDEEGNVTSWKHDAFGRTTSFQPPEFTSPRYFEYAFGRTIPGQTLPGSSTAITEPDGGVWVTHFDFADRPVREDRPDGTSLNYIYNGGQLRRVTLADTDQTPLEHLRYGYDGLGRLAYEAGPSLDTGPYLPGQYGLSYLYTDAGRPLERTGPRETASDAPIFATRNQYGLYGLMISESQVGIVETGYAYDVQHRYPRLKRVTTGPRTAPRVTEYTYAPGGLDMAKISVSGPVSGADTPRDEVLITEFSGYDSFGQPGKVTRLRETGNQTFADYTARFKTDANGRLIQSSTRIGTEKVRDVSYAYRQNGDISKWRLKGDHGQLIEYDSRGRLHRVSLTDDRGAVTQLAYQHDRFGPLGRPVDTQLGDGGRIAYRHDQMGRLIEHAVALPGGAEQQTTTRYNARGLPEVETRRTRQGQIRTEFAYSPEGWLTDEVQFNGTGSKIDSVVYSYDTAGNRTRMARSGQPVTDFVFGAVMPGTQTGDALLEVHTDGAPALLEWDNYGGMTRDQRGYGVVRDVTGRASQIWDTNDYLAAEIGRDHLHRAVHLRSSEEERFHLWGNPLSHVYPLATVRDDKVMGFVADAQTLFGVGQDTRFETAVTDRGGTLLNDGRQFVDLARAFGTGVSKPQSGVPFVFAGQELIEGTPFLNAQQRLYDPEAGLFASTDPMGEMGSRHRFRYASNAPTIRLDPLGTEDFTEQQDGIAEASGEVDIDATGEDPATIDLGPSGGEVVEGWSADGTSVIDPDGARYPVSEQQDGVMFPTSDGGYVNMSVYFFFDAQGVEQWVAFQNNSQSDVETAATEPADPGDSSSETPGLEAGTVPGSEGDPGPDGPEPGQDSTDQASDGSGESGSNDTSADYSDVPPNFNGSPSDWAGRVEDGYTVGDDGYARTPSGQLVIPGLNDAQNPLPHKVLINLGADTVDDALGNAPGMWTAKQLGLIDPNFSPANKAIKDAGFGYTPSEKPREAIAETSVSIAVSAVTAPASAAAAARSQAVLAKGCAGPLGGAPRVIRVVLNVNCFAPETEVMTPTGPRPIADIEPGDEVACGYDDGTAPTYCTVDGVTQTPNRSFAVLEVETPDGQTDSLRVTANHRFYSPNHGWTELQNLSAGDRLNTALGAPATIREIRLGDGGGGLAYNLKVEGAQTYYAGKTALFTHNGGPGGVCPVTKIRNHKQLGKLLGRPVSNSKQVTVGDIKTLFADGKISKTAMNNYLRGKSSSQRKFLLKEAKTNNGKVTARVGDWMGLIPASEARNGNKWHIGHIGSSLRDQIAAAADSMSVNAFRKTHWSGTVFENAADNMRRGAGTSAIDDTLRNIDVW